MSKTLVLLLSVMYVIMCVCVCVCVCVTVHVEKRYKSVKLNPSYRPKWHHFYSSEASILEVRQDSSDTKWRNMQCKTTVYFTSRFFFLDF